jgi:hypothetical protein
MNRTIKLEMAWWQLATAVVVLIAVGWLMWGEAYHQGRVTGLHRGRVDAARGYILKSALANDPEGVPLTEQFYVNRWNNALETAMDQLTAEGFWQDHSAR